VDTRSRLLALCILGLLAACASPPIPPQLDSSRIRIARLPVAFEPNVGQAGPTAQYVGRSPGLRVDLESDGARFIALRGSGEPRTVRLRWLGAATSPVHVEDELPGKVHYYGGDDPAQWRLDIPTFRRVVYREVYPGTDLVFHGTQGSAEFDFVVAPGADPRRIQLEVTEAATKPSRCTHRWSTRTRPPAARGWTDGFASTAVGSRSRSVATTPRGRSSSIPS
jgi:hypothetical protein